MIPPVPSGRDADADRRAAAVAAAALAARQPPVHPQWLWGVHDPWGFAADLIDPWLMLDLCSAAPVIDAAAAVAGPDLILFDSQIVDRPETYAAYVAAEREGRYWPADPLAGAVVPVSLAARDAPPPVALPVPGLSAADLPALPAAPVLVVRLMAATSRYRRDPAFPANRRGAEEQVLVDYETRPLWLVRGADRADNDFVTGFTRTPPRWAATGGVRPFPAGSRAPET